MVLARNWHVPTRVAGFGAHPTRRTAATVARSATGVMCLGEGCLELVPVVVDHQIMPVWG